MGRSRASPTRPAAKAQRARTMKVLGIIRASSSLAHCEATIRERAMGFLLSKSLRASPVAASVLVLEPCVHRNPRICESIRCVGPHSRHNTRTMVW